MGRGDLGGSVAGGATNNSLSPTGCKCIKRKRKTSIQSMNNQLHSLQSLYICTMAKIINVE